MERKFLITSLSLTLLMVLLMAMVLPLVSVAAQGGGTRATRTVSSASGQRPTQPSGAQATQLMQTATYMQATLNAVATNSALDLNRDDDGATVSYTFPEAAVSAAINAAFTAAGYPNSSADLVAGGIVVTIPNMNYGQFTGTLVAAFAIGVNNGEITVTITSVTVAGHSVPTSAFEALAQALAGALNSIIAATSGMTVSYTVDAIVFTDTQMTVSVTLSYTGDLPQPDVTPVFTPATPRPHSR